MSIIGGTAEQAAKPARYGVVRPDPGRDFLAPLVGAAAVLFTVLYLLSDLLEVAQGGFSTLRLAFTYAGEAAIPLFVIGLYALQRPRIGRLGAAGAIAYAYSYVFFTGTVIWALVTTAPDYQAVANAFGSWMAVHGVIMLFGGIAFGTAVIRAGVLPRWTGICLIVGVVLVVAASGLPTIARAAAEGVQGAALIGMGMAVLRRTPATSV